MIQTRLFKREFHLYLSSDPSELEQYHFYLNNWNRLNDYQKIGVIQKLKRLIDSDPAAFKDFYDDFETTIGLDESDTVWREFEHTCCLYYSLPCLR